jgi:hypothetical protein
MSKCELRDMLLRLLPYVNGQKQGTALFAVVLLLAMTHAQFDVPHLHIEPAPIQPITVVAIAATNTASGMMTYGSPAQTTADVPMDFGEMGYRWDTKSL